MAGRSGVVLTRGVDLVEHPLLLPFFIHGDYPGLPLRVGSWDVKADVDNEGGVGGGDPQSYRLDHSTSFPFVGPEAHELGLFFEPLEVGGRGTIPYLEVKHFLFMDLLDCGVLELGVDQSHEVILRWVSESGWFWISAGVGPELLALVDPPVLGRSIKERGGESHLERGTALEVGGEDLEVGETVPKELLDVVVLSLEDLGELEEDGLNP